MPYRKANKNINVNRKNLILYSRFISLVKPLKDRVKKDNVKKYKKAIKKAYLNTLEKCLDRLVKEYSRAGSDLRFHT